MRYGKFRLHPLIVANGDGGGEGGGMGESIGSAIGGMAGGMLGGPIGGMAGSALGGFIGGQASGLSMGGSDTGGVAGGDSASGLAGGAGDHGAYGGYGTPGYGGGESSGPGGGMTGEGGGGGSIAGSSTTSGGAGDQVVAMAQDGTPITQSQWDAMLKAYDLTSIKAAIKSIQDVNTNIEYNHTLSDLSGIGLSDTEKQYFTTQKQIAIDRALGEIEDTFKPEGDAIIAQQIYNLGTNALGGTIGREFYNRWQEKKAKAETNALQDITSTFLTAEQSAIDKNKAYQLDMWNKEYGAESESAKLNLDKAKASAAAQYTWDQSYLDRLTTLRGQDIAVEQQNLDRLLKERLGATEYSAWKDTQDSANFWGAAGSIGSSVVKSDWFNNVVSSWF